MSSLVISGDTSGTVTLAAPAVAGTNTLTLPANTGTLITTASTFSGTGPAFFVRPSSGQTVTLATATKIQLNTEDFDTNNNFDSTTNYRFTPTVAGYYQISAGLRGTGATTNTLTTLSIYKNGSVYINSLSTSSSTTQYSVISVLISMNGSTDYIEFFGTITGTGTASFGVTTSDGAYVTWASGCLVRSA